MAGEELLGMNAPQAYGYTPAQADSIQYAQIGAQGAAPPQAEEIPPELQAYLEQNIHAQTQPQADTFQKSGPGIGTAVLAGAGVGAAAGAGKYMFGTNPLDSDKLFKNGIIDKVDDLIHQENFKNVYETKKEIGQLHIFKKLNIADGESYNALKKLAESAKLEDLSDEMKAILPKGIATPEDAKKLVESAEKNFAALNSEATLLAQNVADNASLKVQTLQHNNLKKLENKITSLADDIKPDDFKKFVQDNKNLFGLNGSEDDIAKALDEYAARGKAGLLADVKSGVKETGENLPKMKTYLNKYLLENYDESKKVFQSDAPEFMQKALDSFKKNKALKAGGIAAGITAAALGIYFALTNGAKKQQV